MLFAGFGDSNAHFQAVSQSPSLLKGGRGSILQYCCETVPARKDSHEEVKKKSWEGAL